MYPRNAASPPRIAVGAVVQISDGAVQTSGCTVRVIEQGGAEGDGGGTTAYSTDGVVLYTPTQAETDQSAFVLIAKKTGCIPVAMTIITSASATAGYAGLDWAVITAPTTTVNLSGTTVKTATDVETDTADIQARLPAALVSGRMSSDVIAISGDTAAADNAESFFDGTGYAGTNNVIPLVTTTTTATNVTTLNGIAANVITAASMNADASAEIADAVWDEAIAGHLSAGSTGEALSNAGAAGTPPTAAAVADAVWDEARSGHVTAGTFGEGVASVIGHVGGDVIGNLRGEVQGDVIGDVERVLEISSTGRQQIADTIFTRAMTESYNTDGAAPTLAQAMFLIMQMLTESNVAGTTVTVKKLDGSTTAATFTLSPDGTTPTGITRAT
jgi:hypothetical protein